MRHISGATRKGWCVCPAHLVHVDDRLCAPDGREVTVLQKIIPMPHLFQNDAGNAAGQQLVAVLLQPVLPAQRLFFVASKGHGESCNLRSSVWCPITGNHPSTRRSTSGGFATTTQSSWHSA